MKTENCLIADFMGWIHHNDPEYDLYEMGNLKYSTSWDCLIPVVERIESMGYSTMLIDNECHILKNDLYNEATVSDTKISATYTAVIEFINYYNQTIK